MAVEAFLKIDTLVGSSQAAGYEGWIEVLSFSWGVNQPTYHSGSGAGAVGGTPGRATFQSFVIRKRLDRSSPTLFADAVSGRELKLVQLHLLRTNADATPQGILAFRFTPCFIGYGNMTGDAEEIPAEEFGFVFGSVQMQQREWTGDKYADSFMGWNLKTNKVIPTNSSILLAPPK